MAEQVAAKDAPREATSHAEPPPLPPRAGPVKRIPGWFVENGLWWMCSFVFHLLLVASLALLGAMGTRAAQQVAEGAPAFEEATLDQAADVPKTIERFEVGETPEDPAELNTDTLTLTKPAQIAQDAEYNDESQVFEHKGGGVATAAKESNSLGLGGFDIGGVGAGPAVKGRGGVGLGAGAGTRPGSGGDAWGFGGRGSGSRKDLLGSGGGTKQSERAVAAALNWLARHQLASGAWGLASYKGRCKDATCSGPGRDEGGDRPTAATALALLPFLAAGQTHESRGPYRKTIAAGIRFLISNQQRNGDLRMGGDMYNHGLAAIALGECYGMTGAKNVRAAAQSALNFIMEAQDPQGGGWRYLLREPGDTSVTGWQIMALKSGQMAYLTVRPAVFEKAKAFLKTVTFEGHSGRFTYMPKAQLADSADYERATTAIGLLCLQYLQMPRTDPAMVEGTTFLMQNPPGSGARNLYYLYYATQVMHNQPGPQWDAWNRKMRRILIDTQSKDGCAAGSWDPTAPTKDIWGEHGGRLMMTSLSALTLEVYYRYLPLYKLDTETAPPAKKADKTEKGLGSWVLGLRAKT
jgi:hypothetical protein